MKAKTTFDAPIKPKFYILIGEDQRKVLGGLEVGEIVRVTIEKELKTDA